MGSVSNAEAVTNMVGATVAASGYVVGKAGARGPKPWVGGKAVT